jgi:hypothetical protein
MEDNPHSTSAAINPYMAAGTFKQKCNNLYIIQTSSSIVSILHSSQLESCPARNPRYIDTVVSDFLLITAARGKIGPEATSCHQSKMLVEQISSDMHARNTASQTQKQLPTRIRLTRNKNLVHSIHLNCSEFKLKTTC